jgi:hypothetical protein
MRIGVDSGRLSAAATEQLQVATTLSEIAGRAAAVGFDAGAAGAPEAEAALMNFCDHWSGSLRANAEAVGGLGSNTEAAASAYVTCDANAIQ